MVKRAVVKRFVRVKTSRARNPIFEATDGTAKYEIEGKTIKAVAENIADYRKKTLLAIDKHGRENVAYLGYIDAAGNRKHQETWSIRKKVPSKNPVPPSSKSLTLQTEKAISLYKRFSGHQAKAIGKVAKPEIPDVLVAIGEITGVAYQTRRDGKLEDYMHEFHRGSRPLFAVSPDGKMIVLLGGAYDFTERGIVDTDKQGRPIE
jgi:hypothetical protein